MIGRDPYVPRPVEIVTYCIICESEIKLSQYQSDMLPRVCQSCKDTMKFAKELREGKAVTISVRTEEQDDY